MRRIFIFLILLSASAIVFNACQLDTCEEKKTYVKWTPIYKKLDEIRLDIKAEAPTELKKPGKLYFYNNYVFINEINEGVHVIDNREPANPKNVAFIKIPGNIDIAVKDNTLYADNYIDLVSIDIKNLEKPTLLGRNENVFSNFTLNSQLGYLIDYEKSNETVEVDCNSNNYGSKYYSELNGDFLVNASFDFAPSASSVGASQATKPSVGVGGSFARFTISGNHLYSLDQSTMKVFDVKNAQAPISRKAVQVEWGIETLFPYKDKLFVGSNSGMFIYDIKSPENPVRLSKFDHARACDPVYVKDDVAFVTLRNGTACQGFQNQLDVINVKDLSKPSLIKSYPMQNPHGLSVEGNTMYLCEGKFGLKAFDVSDLQKIDDNRIAAFTDFFAYDVIALPKNYSASGKKIVMVIGDDGFYQYDADDSKNLKKLSVIAVKK